MKKKILALVLSIALVVTSIPIFAFAVEEEATDDGVINTVYNVDGTTTENYSYDATKYYEDKDSKGATILVVKSGENAGYVFYPNTRGNNGINEALLADTVYENVTTGLELNKHVTQYPINDKGEYTITMEAFTTGEVKQSQVTIPTDIVIVMDQSGSMYENFNNGTRQAAMETAVQKFITSVFDSATTKKVKDSNGKETTVDLDPDDYIDHRIALVTYNKESQIISGGKTNETAFVNVVDKTTHKEYAKLGEDVAALPDDLDGAIKKYDYADQKSDLQTGTHLGMQEAEGILANDDIVVDARNSTNPTEQRNTVVVLFSDGVPACQPTDGKGWSDFSFNCANQSIASAKTIKNDYAATVYSIGIIAGMDDDIISGDITDGVQNVTVGATWDREDNVPDGINDQIYAVDRFFNYLSSNSKDAADLGLNVITENDNGWVTRWSIKNEYTWKNDQFFLAPSDEDGLDQAFENIANNVAAATINLPEETQVNDYLSNYFEVPDGFSSSDVTVYMAKCENATETDVGNVLSGTQYKWEWSDPVEITEQVKISYKDATDDENEGISVEGFDFNVNFVSVDGRDDKSTTDVETDFRGAKLIIQFNVVPTEGFIGGNQVETNSENSGVYAPVAVIDPATGKPKTDAEGNIIYSGDYTTAQKYPLPDTNVIVKYDITTDDQVIYLGNQIMIYDILELNHVKVQGILNEFVNVQFTIYKNGTLDDNGDFATKYKNEVDGKEYTVYKEPDHYYYKTGEYDADGNEITVQTEKGGNYTIENGKLIYKKTNEDSSVTGPFEVYIEPTHYFYKTDGADGKEIRVPLPDDDAAYYNGLVEATFHIPAGQSAKDSATLEINEENLSVQPGECTDYDVRCFANPNNDTKNSNYIAEQLNKASTDITIHVIQPQVQGNDIWVDYGKHVNIAEDGTMTTEWGGAKIDPEDSTQDTSNKYGTTITHEQVTLAHANVNGVKFPPTVYYIYKDKHTGECYKLPNNSETVSVDPVTIETLEDDTITYTIADLDYIIKNEKNFEIVGVQTISSEGKSDVECWNFENGKHDKDLTNNDINVYLNKYDVDITKTVTVTESEWEHYKQSFIFNVSQEVDGTTHTTEVVMAPAMDSGDTENFTSTDNGDGTYTYTCTKTVKDLYAGLDATVTEDTSWSWRYDFVSAEFDDVTGDTISGGTNSNVIKVNYSHVVEESKVDTTGNGETNANVEDNADIYVNTNNSVVFINNAKPNNGNVDTFFVNELTNDSWLSHDDVQVNEFSALTPIDSVAVTGGVE